jgi:hypothetical protein
MEINFASDDAKLILLVSEALEQVGCGAKKEEDFWNCDENLCVVGGTWRSQFNYD